MVVAIQHIDPWTGQLVATTGQGPDSRSVGQSHLISAFACSFRCCRSPSTWFWRCSSASSLAVLLFVVRMSRSNIRKLYRCDVVRSRRYRDPAELEVLHAKGVSVLVIELQGALFFGSAERLPGADVEARKRTGAQLPFARDAAHHRD